jgi:hypothetical protein
VGWDSCPPAHAKIQPGNVYQVRHRTGPFLATPSYSYFVNGRRYSSSRNRNFETDVQAWKFVGQCAGKHALSRYKPETATESQLTP